VLQICSFAAGWFAANAAAAFQVERFNPKETLKTN
jgi:hypothetical protein